MMLTNEVIVECGNVKRSMKAEKMNMLAKAVREGETGKFDKLYKIAYKKAILIALSMSVSRETAEDIAQDTMFKLYENIQKADRVSSWIETVVKNAVLDYHKKTTVDDGENKYKREVSTNTGSYTTSRGETFDVPQFVERLIGKRPDWNPESYYLAREKRRKEREAVRYTLSLLPTQQRKVLELTFCKEMAQDDIAVELGISRSTVAAHVKKGKVNFRKEFLSCFDISDFGFETTSELAAAQTAVSSLFFTYKMGHKQFLDSLH